jgi:hypothetical protein
VPELPKREEPALELEVPALPESVTVLAVSAPVFPVTPVTTTESPGRIELRPTDSDFVILDSGVVMTSVIVPAAVVT